MLSEREVINTLNMLRNEHLDVRTVTLGVSLFDCVSHDIDLFTGNVKAKLHRYASQLVNVCNEVGDKYGIPVVNKRISVSPIAVVGAPFGPDGMVRVCQALDEAAKEAGVDFLGGFSALVEKGFANGDRALIEALPEALATTDRICSSINVASSRSGINMDAVALMGEQILKVAQATADGLDAVARQLGADGGVAAAQLRLAEAYVEKFGQLAKAGTNTIIPANVGDVAGMVATLTQLLRPGEGLSAGSARQTGD